MAEKKRTSSNQQVCVSVSSASAKSSHLSPSDLKKMKEKMSSEANKDVREKYRNLLIQQQEKADGAGEAGLPVEELREMVLMANEAFDKVQRPREAALDAEFLKTCGVLVKSNIESKQYNTTEFHPTEFAKKMITFMHGDVANLDLLDCVIWKRLGNAVSSIYINTAPIESTYAGLDYEKPKKDKIRRKTQKDEVGVRIMPKLMKEPLNDEERQTEELNRVYSILKRRFREQNRKPICFYSFVINPDSYCYTIENLFHTSFLVHMLRAQIMEDENGLPVIIPRESKESKGIEHDAETSQCVISLSTDEFKDIVKTYGIKESCIPPPQNSRKRK